MLRPGEDALSFFRFDVTDWLTSPYVQAMTAEDRGAYVQLLATCWRDKECGLPADWDVLSRVAQVAEVSTLVRERFQQHPTVALKITNLRLLDQWKEAWEAYTRRTRAASSNAAARWRQASLIEDEEGKSFPVSAENADAVQMPCERSANALRTDANRNRNRKGKGKGERPAATAAVVSSAPSSSTEASALTRGGVPWTKEACDDWMARFGGVAPGGEIGKALKPLVGRMSWTAVVRPVWRLYLQREEERFVSPHRFAQKFGIWRRGLTTAHERAARDAAEWAKEE